MFKVNNKDARTTPSGASKGFMKALDEKVDK